jgi:holo-[acyl-carrier protein] synthase
MVIGIGLDIVVIHRFQEFLARRRERALSRLFTESEVLHSATSDVGEILLAQQFAAKEALMKALGTGWGRGIRFTDIQVRIAPAPSAEFFGAALRTAEERGVNRVLLSVSLEPPLAVAAAILER